jgi:NhaP-type Na+/H+ or K+/H+ antiporter
VPPATTCRRGGKRAGSPPWVIVDGNGSLQYRLAHASLRSSLARAPLTISPPLPDAAVAPRARHGPTDPRQEELVTESAFYDAALALAAGLTAQAVAVRAAVPSIVLLLGAGVLLGPDGLGLLDPTAFGAGHGDLVSLAVTVILFEGSLALDVERLRQQQRSLLLLLTVGAAISMTLGTLAAHLFLGMPASVAMLYGATMIVTGPTVVTPLLSRLTVARPVRELLVSEGVLIDPIGAIVAIVAMEAVVGGHAILAWGWLVVARLGVGAAAGAAAGFVVAVVLRRRWIPEDLVNPAVLASVLLVAASASRISAEAGLMAAVAQGVVLANVGLRGLGRLREFKEALTVILLSFLFVVLAAGLRVTEILALGWGALAVVAVVVWVARPLAVLCATAGSSLTMKQRLFVSWICPRGIVAAAVAALFRILLDEAGIPGGAALEALVFVTVAFTVTVQGLTARPVARALGVDHPTPQGTIIVGADHLGRLLERLLIGLHRQVVLIDRSPGLCRSARAEGLAVLEGDALSIDVLEEAGARYADTVVALTRNGELNALVAQQVRHNFQVERVLALGIESGPTVAAGVFPGNFPGVDETNRLLRLGRLHLVGYAVPGEVTGRSLAELPYAAGEFALLVRRGDGVLVATGALRLARGDRVWCARAADAASPLATLLEPVGESAPPGPIEPTS